MSGKYFHSKVYKKDLVYRKNSRLKKAKKIHAVLKDASKTSLKKLSVLDVGCAQGLISYYLSPYFKKIIGVDIDEVAINNAKKIQKKGLSFKLLNPDGSFPIETKTIDIVIANQIYEHVEDVDMLIKEILRVMKPNGLCFIGAGNKLVIKDAHYPNLPFISWIPTRISNFYVRITKSGDYYEPRLKTIWSIRKMLKDFVITDYTYSIIKNPRSFCTDDIVKPNSIITKIPESIFKLLYFMIPNYIFILRKK